MEEKCEAKAEEEEERNKRTKGTEKRTKEGDKSFGKECCGREKRRERIKRSPRTKLSVKPKKEKNTHTHTHADKLSACHSKKHIGGRRKIWANQEAAYTIYICMD